MNLQLANVISDISGTTGLRILHVIVEGERDPQRLATLRDWRIKATPEEVANSLLGGSGAMYGPPSDCKGKVEG